MFVGHGFLAFALVGLLARLRGWPEERALQIAVVAALFATIPDLDILYALVGLTGDVSGISEGVRSFWRTGNVVHRGLTHSLVVGTLAAGVFAAWRRETTLARAASLAVVGGILLGAARSTGFLDAFVVGVYFVGGLAVVGLARRWDFGPRSVGLAALAALWTHPFGDLFTGSPPGLLAPVDVVLVGERVTLHADPSVHFLSAFGLELATAWAALVVAFALTGRSVLSAVDRRAAFGAVAALGVFALPPPTLEVSFHFVFGVLAAAVVAVPVPRVRPVAPARSVATGLTAITVAVLTYGGLYVLFL